MLIHALAFVLGTAASGIMAILFLNRTGFSATGQLQLAAIAALTNLAMHLWVTIQIAFGPDRRALPLRRLAVVDAAAAYLLTFMLVARVASGAIPATAALAATVAGAAAGALISAAGRLQWAYRVPVSYHIPARLLAGTPASTVRLDPELVTLAAGERLAAQLIRARNTIAVCTATFALFLAYGWYSTAHLDLAKGDGTSRIAAAFAAVAGREPHLAAIGFIWPPLPVLSDIPLVIMLQPFGQVLMAGSIMGAFYASIAVILLYRVVREAGCGPYLSLTLTLVFLTYQQFYQSAAAGLSEAPMAAFLLLSMLAFMRWTREGKQSQLILAGVAGAAAVMCRYEAISWVLAQALGIWLVIRSDAWLAARHARDRRAPGESATVALNSAIAYVLPCAFALGMWMVVKADIHGNPIHFLVGQGSTRDAPDTVHKTLAQFLPSYGAHPGAASVFQSYRSLSGTLRLVVERVFLISPLLPLGTIALLAYAAWKRDVRTLVLCGVAWSVISFTALSGYLGSLPPWYRYWYWLQPMGLIVSALCIGRLPTSVARVGVTTIVLILAVIPNVRAWTNSYYAFAKLGSTTHAEYQHDAVFSNEDFGSARSRQLFTRELRATVEQANRLLGPDDLILADGSGPSAGMILFVNDVSRWITPTDSDFAKYLQRAPETVQYVLVPEPRLDVFLRSVMLQTYPGLWEGRLPWAERVGDDIPGLFRFRLFRVVTAQQRTAP